jgi:HK97 family phage major capsid protein
MASAIAGSGQYGPAWLGLSGKDMRNYSVLRGVLAAAAGSVANTFEGEVSAEISKRLGMVPNPHGMFVPLDIQLRDMTAAGTSGSNYLVGTKPLTFMDAVRNRSVVMRLGATQIENVTDNATIPRISADSTAYWLASESVPLTESQPTIGQISLSPKHAGAYTEISRLLAKQAPGIDSLLMATLGGSVGTAIDVAAIAGTGASGQPTGIVNTAGVGSFTGTSLGWAGLVEAQADVIGGAEVDPGQCAYATTAAVAQTLMGRQRFTGTDSPLWQGTYGDGIVAGCRALASGNVPTATMVLGHWPSLVVAHYGVVQIEANPYANFAAGVIGIRAMAAVDLAVRRAADFSVASSIT